MGQWEGLRLMLIYPESQALMLRYGCSGFSQKLVELCVRYVRVMPEVTIDGSALGWSWEVTYKCRNDGGGRGFYAQGGHVLLVAS